MFSLVPPQVVLPEDVAALCAHPDFRDAVEALALANGRKLAALPLIGRWMTRDLGRTALSGAAIVLDGFSQGEGMTFGLLVDSALHNQVCSRARVRLYVERAIANGLMATDAPGEPLSHRTRIQLLPGFRDVMRAGMRATLTSVAMLAPEVEPALGRLDELRFFGRVSTAVGFQMEMQRELFPTDRPVHLFQSRDGGTRMLEHLICLQAPDRDQLLQSCDISRSGLARASFSSRVHVCRLVSELEQEGLVQLDGRRLTASRALSEDVERHYAAMFALARAAVLSALATD
ncbi:winged helix-turn-helix domain-containing protein [Phenylobacterium soli]|uniref:Uncharacterized protein n=1 Tax=Phenylobacterium soli TaxID=2170551 RepID=A0A328AGP5_9CAUL|nr:winged helix-turn-helix domain-containing protein [Phenylobacterium soli]RAK53286.1 hypothetical protein DJ017_01455 [Phenylobacterium soli]